MELEPRFQSAEVEKRIVETWEQEGLFRAGAGARPGGKPFCIVIPPPNVTGSLHIGHAFDNVLQDILIRYHRMSGDDVLWQPGTDHAGIATQMMVEADLTRRGKSRQSMGRDAFEAEIWKWKEASEGKIKDQLLRMGASCDWSRERFTLDEGLSRAVREVFVTLRAKGLIYRAKRLVNWDPTMQTAISDLEIDMVPTSGYFWHIRYPLADDSGASITVGTTRPETMFGDVAVAVHPEDIRYREWIGRELHLPLSGRTIPIIADLHANPETGSGAVKITPAHDFNDFEVGQRHKLPLLNVMEADGSMNNQVPAAYQGLDRFEARSQLLEALRKEGHLAQVEPHDLSLPTAQRSGAVVEPMLTDQWFVDAKPLARSAIEAVRSGRITIIPKVQEKTFFHWLENVQPWCISRQLWWGHRIPAWYGPEGEIFVAVDEAGAQAQAREKFGIPDQEPCVPLRQDDDVLDTWFSSALWPFSTLGWPDETPELEKYYPTNVLVTGHDILFFWVARMIMMGLTFRDAVPFRTVYLHPLIQDESGRKMSKTRGNGIDPLSVIDRLGADPLRLALARQAVQGSDIRLSEKRIETDRNFVTKMWNAARFFSHNELFNSDEGVPERSVAHFPETDWIEGQLSRVTETVTSALEIYRFSEPSNALISFTWHELCDWYLEFVKIRLRGTDQTGLDEIRRTVIRVFDTLLRLLHPFAPFVTDELWRVTGLQSFNGGVSLPHASWPSGVSVASEEARSSEQAVISLVELVSEVRSVRSVLHVPASARVPLLIRRQSDTGEGSLHRLTKMFPDFITRMCSLARIDHVEEPPEDTASISICGETLWIHLAGIIDLDSERDRLTREIEKTSVELAGLGARLADDQFSEKAPAHVVQKLSDRVTSVRKHQQQLMVSRSQLN